MSTRSRGTPMQRQDHELAPTSRTRRPFACYLHHNHSPPCRRTRPAAPTGSAVHSRSGTKSTQCCPRTQRPNTNRKTTGFLTGVNAPCSLQSQESGREELSTETIEILRHLRETQWRGWDVCGPCFFCSSVDARKVRSFPLNSTEDQSLNLVTPCTAFGLPTMRCVAVAFFSLKIQQRVRSSSSDSYVLP